MKKIKNFLDEMKDRIFVQQRSKKFREKIVKNGGSIKDTVSYGLNMCSIPGIVMGVSALIMLELIAYGSGVYVKEKTAALDNIKSFEILFESQLDDLKSYIIFSKDLELYKNESEAFGSKIDKKLSVLKKELSEGEFNSLNDSYIKYKSKINDGFDLHEEVSEYKFIYDNIPFDLKSFSYYLDQKFSVWLSTIDDAVKYDSKINANLNYEKSEVEVWLSKWSTKDKKLQKYLKKARKYNKKSYVWATKIDEQSTDDKVSYFQRAKSRFFNKYRKTLTKIINYSSVKIDKLSLKETALLNELKLSTALMVKEASSIKSSIHHSVKNAESFVNVFKYFTRVIIFLALLFSVFSSLFFSANIPTLITTPMQNFLDEVQLTSKNVLDASKVLSEQASQISSATTQQAASINETSRMLDSIKNMSDKNHESTSETVGNIGDAGDKVSKGVKLTDDLTKSMDGILKSNKEVEGLVGVMESISSKTKLMDEIVFQTKLLSFNASVEASRAGDQGKGFAVVAAEVGVLAQSSGASSKEISDIVKGSLKVVEDLSRENSERVNSGNKLVAETVGLLETINVNLTEVQSSANEVLESSSSQTKAIEEIDLAIDQISKAIEENSNSISQTAQTSQALEAEALSLDNRVKSFKVA